MPFLCVINEKLSAAPFGNQSFDVCKEKKCTATNDTDRYDNIDTYEEQILDDGSDKYVHEDASAELFFVK